MEPVSLAIANRILEKQNLEIEKNELITKLLNNQVKITRENVERIWRVAKDRIPGVASSVIWLETGTERAGLLHILKEHTSHFDDQGVGVEQIPELAEAATTNGWLIGSRGERKGQSPISVYVLEFQNKPIAVAVLVAKNGFIVTMHPYQWDLVLRMAKKERFSQEQMRLLEQYKPRDS